jgi:predicted RNase H-like HicB family nuclease
MRKATYKILEDGTYFGEIPGFEGVYADTSTLEETRDELQSVLEGWLLLSFDRHLPAPVVDGIDLAVHQDVA